MFIGLLMKTPEGGEGRWFRAHKANFWFYL